MHVPAQGCAGALLAALHSHNAAALAPHLVAASDAQQGPLPLLHGIACAEAAWAVEQAAAAAAPVAAAAGRVHRLYPHRRALKALAPLLGEAAFRKLMDPLGCCALSLAAALGHAATLAALLDAGADPNPVEPSGRPMWHPLAAAAMSHDAGSVDSCGVPLVSEATAVAMCELLLSHGADVAACLALTWRPAWPPTAPRASGAPPPGCCSCTAVLCSVCCCVSCWALCNRGGCAPTLSWAACCFY